jgi:AcrR family transcriptional regulator
VSDGELAESILKAASRVVALHGVKKASVSSIAAEAGIARATVYRTFDDKESIIAAMIEYEFARFFGDLYLNVAKLTTLESVIEEGLSFAHAAVEHHFLLQTILREDPAALEPALSGAAVAIEPVIAGIFAPYLPAGRHRDEYADFLARLGLSYIATQGRWDFSKRRDVRQVAELELLAGLRGPLVKVPAATPAPLVEVTDKSLRTRVINATLEEIGSGRYSDISIDRIASKVRSSRATVYRLIPGGNQSLLDMCAEREASRLLAAVVAAMSAESELQRGLLAGMTTIWRHLSDHQALAHVVRVNPDFLNRRIRFDEASRTFSIASSAVEPLLRRWLPSPDAGRLAEWVIRVIISYWMNPASYLDVRDADSVAAFYGRHVAPGVEAIVSLSAVD